MINRLQTLKERYEELNELIGLPEIVAKQDEWQKLVKEHSQLMPIVTAFDEYTKYSEDMEVCSQMMSGHDREMAELAEIEYYEIRDKKDEKELELKKLLLPVDPMDEKNVIIEIRAGAGGEEAGLFGTELMRMYKRLAERMNWSVEDINTNMTELGGVKEVSFLIKGQGAYSKIKYESGVHRVQRVPTTESQGRVHTSTVTVAVLPELEDTDIEINEKEFKIDTYRSSGAGGQHVNKTESAIRITHLVTGLVVECQDERSQMKNKDRAWKIMRAKLYEQAREKQEREYAEKRRIQVGTGERSERIRTYNYPQGRVTDHRINKTMYSLTEFLDGDMFEMLEALAVADQAEKLASGDYNN
ncbi:MAG TPA: peptide chain release factor 1 [Clostridia bacterium]|jgi:peptide chain release factor 1|nr:peptide chain release factor 1 [Clostridia bacterium]